MVLAFISLVRSRFGCSSAQGEGLASCLTPLTPVTPGSTSSAVVVPISRWHR